MMTRRNIYPMISGGLLYCAASQDFSKMLHHIVETLMSMSLISLYDINILCLTDVTLSC